MEIRDGWRMTSENGGMKLGEMPQLPDELMEFAAAWQNWRGDGLPPDRGQVSLDDISLLLPRVMVLEVLSPTEAPFRLVGTSYRDTFGIELTGLNFVDLATPGNRAVRGHRLWAMANTPCGSHASSPDLNPSRAGNLIHTLSFPVRPKQPNQPMQFFGLSFGTRKVDLSVSYGIDMVERLADNFSYIDIGAGLPNQT